MQVRTIGGGRGVSRVGRACGLAVLLVLAGCRAGQEAPAAAQVAAEPAPVSATAEVEERGLFERTRAFLLEHMPARDRAALVPGFVDEHVELALQARAEFPWAAAVPEELFLNDVAPYAVLDEPRDPWRRELLELCRPIVAGCTNATEAAQALNRELFGRLGLHYNTQRERANQSFAESRASGRASCTGLSIALVDACRAVGIPARAVGTPSWTRKNGNHTWVEVWDGAWRFCGADEYDAAGLDRGWFVGDAGDAVVGDPEHGIFASSWKREGAHFPLAWAPDDTSVAAVEVTARYARASEPVAAAVAPAACFVRVFARRGGERVAAEVAVVDPAGRVEAEVTSRAGASDLNDMPSLALPAGAGRSLRVRLQGEERTVPFEGAFEGANAAARTLELYWEDLPLAKSEGWPKSTASEYLNRASRARRLQLCEERAAEMEAKALAVGDKTLRWLEKSFGDAPEGERSLWISLHGGGGAPSEVNDQQWQNQIKLYEPAAGFYVAPRAPTDTWNLWHEAHVDALFDRLIEDYVALRGVDPDRVYLLGYSAGGDGVWQLAPRMADRFAAAAMMAGHPNEASLLGLRNLPFAIFMGGEDKAYDRNKIARERADQLAALRLADPDGYEHFVRIYEGLGHWMQKKDAEALPWMAERRRVAWPKKVVWFQDDVVHERFYWLGRAPGVARAGELIVAEVEGQTIRVKSGGAKGLVLWLSDELVDLDREVIVEVDGARVFAGVVLRDGRLLGDSLVQRCDPRLAACAKLEVGG